MASFNFISSFLHFLRAVLAKLYSWSVAISVYLPHRFNWVRHTRQGHRNPYKKYYDKTNAAPPGWGRTILFSGLVFCPDCGAKLHFFTVGMMNIPTIEEICAMIDEIKKISQQFRYVTQKGKTVHPLTGGYTAPT